MNFWHTKIGKILSYGIHEHNSGLGYIISSLKYVETLEKQGDIVISFKDDKTKERYYKSMALIRSGKEKCKTSMDYIYTKLKEE